MMALLGVPLKIAIMKENCLVAPKYKKKLSNIISIHCTKGLYDEIYHQEASFNCLEATFTHKTCSPVLHHWPASRKLNVHFDFSHKHSVYNASF